MKVVLYYAARSRNSELVLELNPDSNVCEDIVPFWVWYGGIVAPTMSHLTEDHVRMSKLLDLLGA